MSRIVIHLILAVFTFPVACFGQGKVSRPVREKTSVVKTPKKKQSHGNKGNTRKSTKQDEKTEAKFAELNVGSRMPESDGLNIVTASPSNLIDEYEFVDLGLPSGLRWAAKNVGATTAFDNGYYFAWGEADVKYFYKSESSYTFGKSIKELQEEGIVSDSLTLTSRQDAASFYCGVGWSTPTYDDFKELMDNCNWKWIESETMCGYKVEGKNGNSIFLPAVGFLMGTDMNAYSQSGHYWTSTASDDMFNAFSFNFSQKAYELRGLSRYFGRSVRPVVR